MNLTTSNPDDQRVQVLVVEDSAAYAEIIRQTLAGSTGQQFACHTVSLLETALARIESQPPDILLLDLSLPDSTGIDACQRIHLAQPGVPIVVLTGLDDEDTALDALQSGAQDYLVKGQIDSALLVRSLRYAIERQRVETALKRAHDELEERVAERTTELRQANDDLRQAIRDRDQAEELARSRHEELAHLARLNTLGELASSLAHELNQPLTAIVAYTKSCLRRLSDDQWNEEELRDELEDQIGKAAEQAQRGAKIIQRLRRLVSKREALHVAFDINESIREVADLVAAESRSARITLRLQLEDSLPTASADSVQIEQVLLNLIRNGIEAMSEHGGELMVASGLNPHHNLEVRVIDNGPVADPDTVDRVFDPFFSTKKEGLGLGLSISRSIIESHRGKLTATPNDQHGLTFKFVLPVCGSDEPGGLHRLREA